LVLIPIVLVLRNAKKKITEATGVDMMKQFIGTNFHTVSTKTTRSEELRRRNQGNDDIEKGNQDDE